MRQRAAMHGVALREAVLQAAALLNEAHNSCCLRA
ncbi:hypothetical protein C7401_106123 [Paraburkholderia unamae]|nr:hypothetical protein C7401_106123 [Paraburkholderia unamae]